MEEYINKLKFWKKELNKIPNCKGISFRKKGNSFIEGPYIVGYDSKNDISFRIEFCPEKTTFHSTHYPVGFLFHIEWKGHNRLNTRIAMEYCDEGFESYKYMLEGIIDFENQFSKNCSTFPKLTTEDSRDKKINEIISEIRSQI